ncbi:hypothetical protein ACYB9R_02230 [Alcaligenes aquatilis]|nr:MULTISPECIES: hypothetical protein [Alcaligenes]MCH4225965.1 hypothetical protein [Alcaligenes faecalis]UYY88795.1 hypothetical protein OKX01_07910 [Alcaligenes sp. SMD-FA]
MMRGEGATVRPYWLRDTACLYLSGGLMRAFGGIPYLGVRRFDSGCLY